MLYVIRSNINNKIGAGHIYRLLRLSDYLLSQNKIGRASCRERV